MAYRSNQIQEQTQLIEPAVKIGIPEKGKEITRPVEAREQNLRREDSRYKRGTAVNMGLHRRVRVS